MYIFSIKHRNEVIHSALLTYAMEDLLINNTLPQGHKDLNLREGREVLALFLGVRHAISLFFYKSEGCDHGMEDIHTLSAFIENSITHLKKHKDLITMCGLLREQKGEEAEA